MAAPELSHLENHLQVQIDDRIIVYDLDSSTPDSPACKAVSEIDRANELYVSSQFFETGFTLGKFSTLATLQRQASSQVDAPREVFVQEPVSVRQQVSRRGNFVFETL